MQTTKKKSIISHRIVYFLAVATSTSTASFSHRMEFCMTKSASNIFAIPDTLTRFHTHTLPQNSINYTNIIHTFQQAHYTLSVEIGSRFLIRFEFYRILVEEDVRALRAYVSVWFNLRVVTKMFAFSFIQSCWIMCALWLAFGTWKCRHDVSCEWSKEKNQQQQHHSCSFNMYKYRY